MTADPEKPGARSVSVGGDAIGNVIVTGDQNVVRAKIEQVTLPPPETVDIAAEIQALREALAALDTPDARKIRNAFEDVDDELAKPEPDKDEVGQALERALGYAEKVEGFADKVESLAPKVVNAVSWLGKNWHRLLSIVGLAI